MRTIILFLGILLLLPLVSSLTFYSGIYKIQGGDSSTGLYLHKAPPLQNFLNITVSVEAVEPASSSGSGGYIAPKVDLIFTPNKFTSSVLKGKVLRGEFEIFNPADFQVLVTVKNLFSSSSDLDVLINGQEEYSFLLDSKQTKNIFYSIATNNVADLEGLKSVRLGVSGEGIIENAFAGEIKVQEISLRNNIESILSTEIIKVDRELCPEFSDECRTIKFSTSYRNFLVSLLVLLASFTLINVFIIARNKKRKRFT